MYGKQTGIILLAWLLKVTQLSNNINEIKSNEISLMEQLAATYYTAVLSKLSASEWNSQ